MDFEPTDEEVPGMWYSGNMSDFIELTDASGRTFLANRAYIKTIDRNDDGTSKVEIDGNAPSDVYEKYDDLREATLNPVSRLEADARMKKASLQGK